jgi:Arc/MetJ-type ribon-helix-helix transcriptional regulator
MGADRPRGSARSCSESSRRPDESLALPRLPGMIAGMTTSKIAVSLPTALVARARRAVARRRAESVSAYIASALAEKAKLEELAELLREMLAETGGPLTAAERRAADEALGGSRRRRRRAA